MIPSPQIVELIGRLRFDWVLIDCVFSGSSDLAQSMRYPEYLNAATAHAHA